MAKESSKIREPEGEIRRRLLASATELFVRKGYDGTSVREIVAAAGVSPPVLYYYFGNKEGLYLEIFQDAAAQFSAVLSETMARPGTAREGILALSARVHSLCRERIEVLRLMYAITFGPPQSAPFFDHHGLHDAFQDAYRVLLARGVEAGEFAPGDDATRLYAIMGVVTFALEMELCHPDRSLGEEGLRRAMGIVFRGMAPVEGMMR